MMTRMTIEAVRNVTCSPSFAVGILQLNGSKKKNTQKCGDRVKERNSPKVVRRAVGRIASIEELVSTESIDFK